MYIKDKKIDGTDLRDVESGLEFGPNIWSQTVTNGNT